MNNFFVWYCFFARLEHPKKDSLDEYMEYLIPKVRYFGEDLSEESFYKKQRWLELKDGSTDVILHIFEPILQPAKLASAAAPGSEYYKVTNGNVATGSWSYMKGNKMVIKMPGNELYDLGFLNPYVFILRKHGDNAPLSKSRYIVLVSESGIRRIMTQALGTNQVDKETLAELLYHYYAYNNFVTGFIIVGLPLILLVLYVFYK
jgi:hypothetical protein